MPDRPPMPEPMSTPVRSCFSAVSASSRHPSSACVGGRHGVDDEVVDLALLLRLHPIVGIELALGRGAARNEAGDLAGEVVDLELLDAARAALPGDQRSPRGLDAAADGRDETQVL